MGIPALASAAGAASAGSSAGSSAAGAAAVSGGMGILSSAINQIANKHKQKRQQQYTEKNMKLANDYSKQLMDYENNINTENWYRENEREDYLMANSKRIEAQALRDAGFNPALANGVSSGIPSVPDIAPSSSSASAPMGASGAPTSIDGSAIAADAISAMKVGAEINLLKAQADNLESQTEGNNQKNFFTNETMWDNIRMTKQEMNQKEYIAKFMNDNPELNRAVAQSQATLNENISQDTSLKQAQQDLLYSQNDEVKARTYLEQAQKHLTEVQIMALNDSNLRENSNNLHWLLNRVSQVQRSNISSSDKSDLLLIYGACIDNISKVSHDYRQSGIDDFLNSNQQAYNSLNSLEHDVRAEDDDEIGDFVEHVVEAVAIGGGMRLGGNIKKSFNVSKTPKSQTKTSKQKAKSFEDDIVNSHKRNKNKGRKD